MRLDGLALTGVFLLARGLHAPIQAQGFCLTINSRGTERSKEGEDERNSNSIFGPER
jgi:hypothetical protein